LSKLLVELEKFKNIGNIRILRIVNNKNIAEIDLTDVNNDRVNIKSKENIKASTYLVDKQVYELNIVNLSICCE